MPRAHRTGKFLTIAFSLDIPGQPLLVLVFFLMYLVGVLGNVLIILVILVDYHLHTAMYCIFCQCLIRRKIRYVLLCNLSFVDICYMTITLPKLMDILLSGDNSFLQCFSQLYFFNFIAGTEKILLSVIAYDHFVAICIPLHYQLIMDKKNIVLLLCGTWISGCLNSLFFIILTLKLPFCGSNKIIIQIESLVFGPSSFWIGLLSYIKIIKTMLIMRCKRSRRKTFSTCASHLIVLSRRSDFLDQIFSLLYTGITPMLNPLVYSLRNKVVSNALLQVFGIKKTT
uniref:G-protein coupled receptors family 1 profile domain-containing protein n=1 Tax=Pyxicephalus adspersus TaxID=30357 RepID=A0AAV3AT90_PYXAD|nr:TPA: hypothetical protein GDO54_005814 [Pyxicephalus adspersus]